MFILIVIIKQFKLQLKPIKNTLLGVIALSLHTYHVTIKADIGPFKTSLRLWDGVIYGTCFKKVYCKDIIEVRIAI